MSIHPDLPKYKKVWKWSFAGLTYLCNFIFGVTGVYVFFAYMHLYYAYETLWYYVCSGYPCVQFTPAFNPIVAIFGAITASYAGVFAGLSVLSRPKRVEVEIQ